MTKSRVIVALDFSTASQALDFTQRIDPSLCRLKVGLELYTVAGPAIVEKLAGRGFDVFLDLKFHDIPTTVAKACRQACDLGAWMINVHALGGPAMLAAARDAVDTATHRPILVGVTVLTSHDGNELTQIGLRDDASFEVMRLAKLVHTAGLDGVVCSGHEAPRLRESLGERFTLVTPGIRPRGVAIDDQRRTMTPAEAASAGSDYLVIGRPITQASDPVRVLGDIDRDLRAMAPET